MEKINRYCNAPLVSASIWPGNKITPCCIWQGESWSSIHAMQDAVTKQFDVGVPANCQGCGYRHAFDDYPVSLGLQMLDMRNDNLCNLRCRSCTPQWSSAIAQEENIIPVRNFSKLDLDLIDFDSIKTLYICGGEPFMSNQHQEILTKIKHPQQVTLLYNTNCTTLTYQGNYIPDLWKDFSEVTINASIDAVGVYAQVVRSGSKWTKIDSNLRVFETLAHENKIVLNVVPYISALNVWWLDSWLARFDAWAPENINPIMSAPNDNIGVGIIPFQYRSALIDKLNNNKFQEKFSPIVDILTTVDNTNDWNDFLIRQSQIDANRNENWMKLFTQHIS